MKLINFLISRFFTDLLTILYILKIMNINQMLLMRNVSDYFFNNIIVYHSYFVSWMSCNLLHYIVVEWLIGNLMFVREAAFEYPAAVAIKFHFCFVLFS